MEFKTSHNDGIDGAAPILVTAMADAVVARFKQSSMLFCFIIPARKKPVKVSPAAVVSTGTTLFAGR